MDLQQSLGPDTAIDVRLNDRIGSKQTVQWSPETNNLTRTTGETGYLYTLG